MEFRKIKYSDLNPKQKESYNFQKIASVLADYGFNCIKLTDDWAGADFLAYHKDRVDTLKVQLKGRLTINKKYTEKELYMAFPINNEWYLIKHDLLVNAIGKTTTWLNSKSWTKNGIYHSSKPSKKLLQEISKNILKST